MSVRHKAKRKRKVPLVFKHIEPKELAEQLTYMEFKAIRRISVSDLSCHLNIFTSVEIVTFF